MKIVMIEPINISMMKIEEYRQRFEAEGHQLIAYSKRAEDDQEMIKRVKDADILIIANQPLSAEVINSAENLKMISVAFTGFDHIAMEACRENDILVSNSSGYANQAVAELAFGLTIGLMRNIKDSDEAVRASKTRAGLNGNELAGKNFGIIGFGAIGQKTARIADAFGCKILVDDHKKHQLGKELGVEYLPIAELLRKSDIVSLHVPLKDSTVDLIDAEKIALMKKSAILINTARGSVVNSEALAKALNKEEIAGAGIDVFEMEPPIPEDHPLLNAKNTILTPHTAFATEEAFIKRAEIVFANIEAWFKEESQNVVS
ncbi:2-hydroxyacid dehydrogenase [Halanaerobium congolense]|uniref:2-hydroxyacid dehydrogenase n=1 Tax=Halanaerobium congolense TaxID=54121 RepID=UPI0008898608|nr:2-hydroxyacid dehydrogenase [Halanaerobium congolense]PUU88320.1 MAG: D-3-phosphoglycerate dehydrogenase [Halanaerobium sp.]SDK76447.1 D-3-phosphoglycerate dehydrogenase [Halanaerobium congolense]SDM49199.1 D-3-phosphoglycerate dehydrogenase [Halanaerobium congolense]